MLPRIKYGEENHNGLKLRQDKLTKSKHTLKEPISLFTQYTVAIQGEDGGPWMHDTVIDPGNEDHNGRSYKIFITNTRKIVIGNTRHIKCTPITSKERHLTTHN